MRALRLRRCPNFFKPFTLTYPIRRFLADFSHEFLHGRNGVFSGDEDRDTILAVREGVVRDQFPSYRVHKSNCNLQVPWLHTSQVMRHCETPE